MDWRQIGDRRGVLDGDGQLVIAVVDEATTQQPRISPKIGAPEPGFDRDLPKAHHAEQRLVVGVFDHAAGSGR